MKRVYIKNLLVDLPDKDHVVLSFRIVDEMALIARTHLNLYWSLFQKPDGTIIEISDKQAIGLRPAEQEDIDFIFTARV